MKIRKTSEKKKHQRKKRVLKLKELKESGVLRVSQKAKSINDPKTIRKMRQEVSMMSLKEKIEQIRAVMNSR